MHVSCEFNRSVDTHLCNMRYNRLRVFRFFLEIDLRAGDSPGSYQGRRVENKPTAVARCPQLTSARTVSCTEAAAPR